MACVNAAGNKMSPLFIVKGKTSRSLHGFNTLAAPQGTRWHYQANGWMNDEIGERWFEDVFLMECGKERPQLLILDGHSSHESLSIIELAIQNNIHILSLPPHTTHALQPLDRCVFGPLNNAYNTACSDFLNQNPLNAINKWSFPGVLAAAWKTALTKVNIQAGFKSCGIYPFNPSAVAPELLKPSIPSNTPLPLQTPADEVTACTPDIAIVPRSCNLESPSHSSVSNPSACSSLTCCPASYTIVSSTVGTSLCPSATPSGLQSVSSTLSAREPLAITPVTPVDIPVTGPPIADDPEMLLGLINAGNVEVYSPDAEGTVEILSGFWDSAIADIFLPPQLAERKSDPKPRSKSSSHRLLTSEEIVLEKQILQQKKENANLKKQNRIVKRASKKKQA